MKKNLLSILFLFTIFSCSSPKNKEYTREKPIILVSVAPYIELIQQIAGDTVDVRCAVPPGVDPHNWEPNYKDMDRLQGASAWFTIGEEFEPRLSVKLHETSPRLVIYKLQKDAPSEGHCAEHGDTHVHSTDSHFWLDPILDIHQGRYIEEILSSVSPHLKTLYKENLRKLEQDLLSLNESTKKQLYKARSQGKYLVTTHGAYTYYCERYDLHQITIEPSGGKEPRTKEITKIVDEIQKKIQSVVGVFLQPQHSNKAALIIAQKLNLPTYMIDPYQQNYMETIRSLTTAVTSGQNAKKVTSFNDTGEKEEAARDLFYSEPKRPHDH